MPITSRELTAGFRGSFYENGVKMLGCTGWSLTRSTTLTQEGELDQKLDIPVEQSLQYKIAVNQLIVNSDLTRRILDADRNSEQLRFLFIGESRRNDGQVERFKMDGACISGDVLMGGVTRGESRKRDIEFQLDTVPDLDAAIA
jgi:hypothetical protein